MVAVNSGVGTGMSPLQSLQPSKKIGRRTDKSFFIGTPVCDARKLPE